MSDNTEANANPFALRETESVDNNVEATANHLSNAFRSKITQQIGSGEDAKHSIVWITIRWSFIIPAALTLIILIFLGVSYYNKDALEIEGMRKYILAIWGIFTPLITLSLGYAFGKDIKS